MDLPYKAEYAKSSRASCRGCKSSIEKDTLRLAVMVQSPVFDGKTPNWFHFLCFFTKQRPKTCDDIEHFESLRWEDQEKIKSKIASGGTIIVPAKKGKKRDATTAAANKTALKDFVLEYSKSSRAICRGCEQKVMKEEIRISKKDFETDVGKRYGGQDMWHHLTCFAKLRAELGYFECGDQLPGFKSLKKDDQQEVKKQLPAIKQEDIPEKKIKIEDEVDSVNGVNDEQLRSQSKLIFSWYDKLKKVPKPDLQLLLSENNQDVPVGVDIMIDRLSDMLAFGAMKRCTVCKDGQLVFDKLGYKCDGDLTDWSKCDYTTKEPLRGACTIPSELSESYSFLSKYKYKKRQRLIKDAKPTTTLSIVAKKEEEDEDHKPKVERQLPALYNMDFVIIGKSAKKKDVLKKQIVKLGGKVTTKISSANMAVISTPEDVEKMISRVSEAQIADIQVVSEDFVDEADNYCGRIPELVTKKSICTWGSDPHTRLPQEPSTSKSAKSKSRFEKSGPSKITMKLKDGGAVDPDSGLEHRAHIYQKGKDKYTAVLGLTDIQTQKNKFYKLQLLEADNASTYWLFRAWGRIGTTIGGNKVESMEKNQAIKDFCSIYKEHTGNDWRNRHNFVKVPRCYYPIDVDYGESAEESLNIQNDIPSKLDKPIQDIVKFIFDVDIMKKVMLEFELDTEKMPLGKLSKKQLQSAYGVLNELQNLVESEASMARFIDASNRFYTFVPHSFGTDNPTIINDIDTIKKKIEMVDNLMEMEIAYNLMKTCGSGGKTSNIDAHYEQLKTEMEVLDRNSEEFLIIQEYVTNTHAATHSSYKLVIEEVFVIKRQGEEKRYKPFRKLHNRKLLWHGSRRTNFAGILSQGLRIAPPEAPATGYMFGKGIYFADMVSKSANYCCTSFNNNTGLMLLCEVALGEMDELYHAKYVEKLPKGKHSVKGIGRTEPDPDSHKTLHGDVQVPVGVGKTVNKSANALLYNEYIVYDVAQVKMKYLLKLNFNYKF